MTEEKPKAPAWNDRHEATHEAAHAIIDAEIAERDAKTERLRVAREAMESGKATPVVLDKRPKPVKPRRARTA